MGKYLRSAREESSILSPSTLWDISSIGRALGLQPRGHGFEFRMFHHGLLAQSVEQSTFNREVTGSNPVGSTTLM